MSFATPFYVMSSRGPVHMHQPNATWDDSAPSIQTTVDQTMADLFDLALSSNDADHREACIVLWMWSRLRTALYADRHCPHPLYRMSSSVENFVEAHPGYFSDPVPSGRITMTSVMVVEHQPSSDEETEEDAATQDDTDGDEDLDGID